VCCQDADFAYVLRGQQVASPVYPFPPTKGQGIAPGESPVFGMMGSHSTGGRVSTSFLLTEGALNFPWLRFRAHKLFSRFENKSFTRLHREIVVMLSGRAWPIQKKCQLLVCRNETGSP
jgi:hypothetical protein